MQKIKNKGKQCTLIQVHSQKREMLSCLSESHNMAANYFLISSEV